MLAASILVFLLSLFMMDNSAHRHARLVESGQHVSSMLPLIESAVWLVLTALSFLTILDRILK